MEYDFEYIYSASDKKDIINIRNKYLSEDLSISEKVKEAKNLELSARKTVFFICIVNAFLGLSIVFMGVYLILTTSSSVLFSVGVFFGFVGIFSTIASIPLYYYITKKTKKKISPKIVSIIDEASDKQ